MEYCLTIVLHPEMAKAFFKYLLSLVLLFSIGSGQMQVKAIGGASNFTKSQSSEEAIQNAVEINQDLFAILKNVGEIDHATLLEVPFYEEEEEKLNSSVKYPLGGLAFILINYSDQRNQLAMPIHLADAHPVGQLSDRYLLFEVFRI